MPSKCYIATRNTLWIYARRLKLRRHSHMTYKVDLCFDTNHYSIVSWIKKMRPKVFNPVIWKYKYSHVITCVEVEHGRNHLITGHWWKPLTSVREITNNVSDSQGTLVQSNECESMIWGRTFGGISRSGVNNENPRRMWGNPPLRHSSSKVPICF